MKEGVNPLPGSTVIIACFFSTSLAVGIAATFSSEKLPRARLIFISQHSQSAVFTAISNPLYLPWMLFNLSLFNLSFGDNKQWLLNFFKFYKIAKDNDEESIELILKFLPFHSCNFHTINCIKTFDS